MDWELLLSFCSQWFCSAVAASLRMAPVRLQRRIEHWVVPSEREQDKERAPNIATSPSVARGHGCRANSGSCQLYGHCVRVAVGVGAKPEVKSRRVSPRVESLSPIVHRCRRTCLRDTVGAVA